MKFDYTNTLATDTRGYPVSRPMVEAVVEGPTGIEVTVAGLIDSGGDTSIMNSRYADLLKIALDDLACKRFVGIDGLPVTTHIATITVRIPRVGGTLNLPVAFTDSPAVDLPPWATPAHLPTSRQGRQTSKIALRAMKPPKMI